MNQAIICSKQKCSHRMYENELVTVKTDGIARTQGCPKCGEESYYVMTEGQIKWWDKKKEKEEKAQHLDNTNTGQEAEESLLKGYECEDLHEVLQHETDANTGQEALNQHHDK